MRCTEVVLACGRGGRWGGEEIEIDVPSGLAQDSLYGSS